MPPHKLYDEMCAALAEETGTEREVDRMRAQLRIAQERHNAAAKRLTAARDAWADEFVGKVG